MRSRLLGPHSEMDFDSIKPLPELECPGYHKLGFKHLERIGDPESMFERGIRHLNTLGVRYDARKGYELIRGAALKGHPVALAYIKTSTAPSEDFYSESASRGHPYGENCREETDS